MLPPTRVSSGSNQDLACPSAPGTPAGRLCPEHREPRAPSESRCFIINDAPRTPGRAERAQRQSGHRSPPLGLRPHEVRPPRTAKGGLQVQVRR